MTSVPDLPAPPPRNRLRPLMLGAMGGLLVGTALFATTYLGILPGKLMSAMAPSQAIAPIAFVPLDPLIISLGPAAQNRHLRIGAQVEVAAVHQAEIEHLRPRMMDLMNSYLRALQPEELQRPAALLRLRAQMLRRLQLVTGEGRIRDLLITEFLIT